MKKVAVAVAGMFMAIVLSQCSSNPAISEEEQSTPFQTRGAEGVSREPNPQVPSEDRDALVGGNIQFAFDMYNQLASISENEGKNLLFSPYSISIALAMTLAGAEGETETQIRDAMRFALQEPDLHRAFNQLDMDMETAAANQENLTLSVANSFWGQYDKEFEPSFLEVMARNYGAGLNLLDFAGSPDNSRMTINTWVEGQTNNRIKNLLPPGSITLSTRLVITNAVYFLADWLKTFDPQLTEEKTFYRENGETVQAPLMSLSGSDENAHVIAAVTGKSKAVQLPYVGNRFAMLAVMPREGTLAAYEQEFDSEELQAVVENLDSTEMTVVLPRFTFGTQSFSLTEALGKMGMSIPFSPGADFSGIDGPSSQLFISNIIHKAFIAVDEQGTEAAAATAVMMTDCAVDYNLQFVANRPFIYLIRDCHTGAILFMGRVMDPMDEGQ